MIRLDWSEMCDLLQLTLSGFLLRVLFHPIASVEVPAGVNTIPSLFCTLSKFKRATYPIGNSGTLFCYGKNINTIGRTLIIRRYSNGSPTTNFVALNLDLVEGVQSAAESLIGDVAHLQLHRAHWTASTCHTLSQQYVHENLPHMEYTAALLLFASVLSFRGMCTDTLLTEDIGIIQSLTSYRLYVNRDEYPPVAAIGRITKALRVALKRRKRLFMAAVIGSQEFRSNADGYEVYSLLRLWEDSVFEGFTASVRVTAMIYLLLEKYSSGGFSQAEDYLHAGDVISHITCRPWSLQRTWPMMGLPSSDECAKALFLDVDKGAYKEYKMSSGRIANTGTEPA